jgi:hypothetical protein
MIRRDVRLADGMPGWALISQIEHARISALLASQCRGRFGPVNSSLIRDEVLVAIAAHDDGWREWEQSPQLDPKHGRPLSFMELPVRDATAIWSKSIAVAEEIGPLAAWMVSGHFLRLLEHSEHARFDPLTQSWLAEISPRREAWFTRWQAIDPDVRDVIVAEEALDWLWAFDEASLWFCCHCPVGGEPRPDGGVPYVAGRGTPIELELRGRGDSASGQTARGVAIASPWRFDADLIDFEVAAQVAPATRYADARQLLAACESHPLKLFFRLETSSARWS